VRSARIWAKKLIDADGHILKCEDVENGGDNQRAQLLVPVDKLNMARQALVEYKESISPFTMRENNFRKRIAQAHPAEIYVPTAAAHHTLDFIKGLSPITTWVNAPASIRQPPQPSTTVNYRSPNTDNRDKHRFETAMREYPDLAPRFQNKNDTQQRPDQTQQSLADTNTTSSLMTKSLATQQRFQELANAIRQHNIDTRSHQAEFLKVNTRFDDLEGRVLTMMTFCKDTSQNVLELRKETTEHILEMPQEAVEQAAKFRNLFSTMTQMIHSMANNSAQTSDSSETSAQSDNISDTMSVQSLDTAKQGTSPRKKKGKRNKSQSTLNSIAKNHNPNPDQDPSAHYDSDSTPAKGET
jgi:rubrerythrin